MSATWGHKFKITLFGESHGPAVGVVIDGVRPGLVLDLDFINTQLSRRRGGDAVSTPRREPDAFEIISGVRGSTATGAPLCMLIKNIDAKSEDYEKHSTVLRPSHADYTSHVKYGGFADKRGGGIFSGRLTAPIVLAGSVAMQMLRERGIIIVSHVLSIEDAEDRPFDMRAVSDELALALQTQAMPVIDKNKKEEMISAILSAKSDGDSAGGVIECAILSLPPGVGEPMFGSLESRISSVIFAVPGVKGIEFGGGFSLSRIRGSEANDPFYTDGKAIYTTSNNSGGINGGISNGMPVVFRAVFRPTPSISRPQDTVDIKTMENTTLEIKGRHDPCIASRAAVVIESAAAIAVLDFLI